MTKEQEAALEKLGQASVTKVVQQVRDLGHYPKRNAVCSLAERQLAEKLCRALKAKQLSPEQEAELDALRVASQGAEKKAKQFSPEQEAELEALQQAERDARAEARIADAEEPPHPMEEFAEEAENRIDQDLLMLESGIRTKELLRRLAVYKELVSFALAQQEEFVQRYAERVRQASVTPAGKLRYIPGSEVDGLPEPRDARAQGGDAGTGIRRRPAARNAEEGVRRLSRRTDAT